MPEDLIPSQETPAPSAEVPETSDSSTEAPASTESPEAPATPELEKPKQRGGFQRRIDELTTARRVAEEQNRQLLEILQNQTKPAQPAPVDSAPDINQYQKYEDYLAAHARWSAREEFKRIQAETRQATQQQTERQQQAEQQRQTQERVREWQGMVERGETKYPDFYEVVHDESVPIHPVMVEPIVTSEMGEEIAYYLGKNKAEARRIAGLTPVAMIREIGKLEVTLKAASKSNAPAPINPLTGRKAGSDRISPDDDMRTFIAKRNKELGRT